MAPKASWPILINVKRHHVIANEVKQSMTPDCMDCRVAARLAMTIFFPVLMVVLMS